MLPFTFRQAPLALLALALLMPSAQAVQPAELLAEYSAKAGAPASAQQGEKLFTARGTGDMGWSCSTCHGNPPTGKGRNAISEKSIPALAPAANPASFTDRSKVEGWFKNNCKDVLGRECTVAEKADILSWLLTLKP